MGKSLIITTGGGTDTSEGSPKVNTSFILSGYTIYDAEGEKQTGSLATKTLSKTLDPSGSVTIPAGYYNGNNTNKVSAVALSSKTGATADPGHILKDKTGWRDGAKKTGTMVSVGTKSGTLSANGTFTVPVGWHKGDGKVTQSLGAQAATNVTPGTAQKTVIAASKWTTGAQTVLGNANLLAGNIKKDVTIFGVKGTFFVDTSDFKGSGVYLIKDGNLMMNPTVTFSKDIGEYAGSYEWITNNCGTPTKVGNALVFTMGGHSTNSTSSNSYKYDVGSIWTLKYSFPIRVNTASKIYAYVRLPKIEMTVNAKGNSNIDIYVGNIWVTLSVFNKSGSTSTEKKFSDPWTGQNAPSITTSHYSWYFDWQVSPGTSAKRLRNHANINAVSTMIKSGYNVPSNFNPWAEATVKLNHYGTGIWSGWNGGDGKAFGCDSIMKVHIQDLYFKATR